MQEKFCKYCGKPFTTNSGTKIYCDREHYATCIVCGNQFVVNNKYLNDVKNTCSRKCTSILRKQTCQEKYGGIAPASSLKIQAKMKKTNLERYGVESPMQSLEIKEKVKQQNREKYGVDWALQSKEIRSKRQQTNIERYGVIHPIQNDRIKSKIQATNLKRYGSENFLGSAKGRNAIHQSYFQKTGYYEPFSNPDVIAKSEVTWKSKYGVNRPLQSEEIQKHLRETYLSHYGVDHPFKVADIRRKIKQTNIEKYGVDNVAKSPEIQRKIRQTHIDKYGQSHFSQTKEWKIQTMRDPSKVDNLLEFRQNPQQYIQIHFSNKPTYKELVESIGTSEGLRDTLEKFDCLNLVDYVFSYMEREVKEILLSIDPNLKIIVNTKKIITPYELDIYLPDYNIGIECNPTETHNSSFNMFQQKTDPDPTPYKYHQMKSDLCESKGIFLFHIFGPDWNHRKDVIISMIRNLLNKNDYKIYGRNTTIRQISSGESSKFLNTNHRQGNANASIRLGLFYEGELVSVMTFGKMRQSIGTSVKDDTSNTWELVRFCNKMNTSVIGGASKLFKYFIEKYNPIEIRSFSDRAHTRGNLYQTLGFNELRRSSAGYVWIDYKTDMSYHRVNAQKQNIRKFLKDDNIDIENLTETQIMESYGFVQLFDSGTITWQWISN